MPQRQRQLLLIAAVAVAVLVADTLILTPLVRLWKSQTTRLAELRRQVTQGELLLERKDGIRARWAQMRTNSISPEVSTAESQVLKAFDRWSQDSGVNISSIRPQWKDASEDHATLECRAEAFGSLATLTRFLYLVEQDPLGIRIESLSLAARDNDAQQLTLTLQVSGLLLKTRGS